MLINILGQQYLNRKRKIEMTEKAKRRFQSKPKLTADQSLAKIQACGRKQARKGINRYQCYRRSLLNNQIMSSANVARLVDLSA